MTRRWSVLLTAVVLTVLAGCTQPGGQSGSEQSGASPTNGPSSTPPTGGPSSARPTFGAPSTATGKATPPAAETTLTGTVEAGVEGGCLVLASGGTTYLLLGGDRSVLKPGVSVTVRGRPTPGVVTTCMQGVPFQVSSAGPG